MMAERTNAVAAWLVTPISSQRLTSGCSSASQHPNSNPEVERARCNTKLSGAWLTCRMLPFLLSPVFVTAQRNKRRADQTRCTSQSGVGQTQRAKNTTKRINTPLFQQLSYRSSISPALLTFIMCRPEQFMLVALIALAQDSLALASTRTPIPLLKRTTILQVVALDRRQKPVKCNPCQGHATCPQFPICSHRTSLFYSHREHSPSLILA